LVLILLLLAGCKRAPSIPTPTASVTPQPTATTSPSPTSSLPPEVAAVTDPLAFQETLASWTAGKPPAYPDSSAISATLSTLHAISGEHSLALTFDYKEGTNAIYSLEMPLDLSGYQNLTLSLVDLNHVLNAAAIALSTGQDWLWHETQPQDVQPGETILGFDLQGNDFKTVATGWQPGAKVANLDQVKRISIILYPKKAGTIYLQNVTDTPTGTASITAASCPERPNLPPAQSPLALSMPQDAKPKQYSPLEFDLVTTTQVKNPFDPAQIDLVVDFTRPDGKKWTIPAFWYQAYDSAGRRPCGEPGWKARLTPTLVGQWTAQAEIRNLGIQSEPVSFRVEPSTSKGFVQVHPINHRYLAFENGETFFPIGLNLGWWNADPLGDYRRWMDKLHDNQGSIMRAWMASWSFGIEWNDTGLGNYASRLRQAWLLDQVFGMAQERGIYIDLVLLNHGAFSDSINPEWEWNPYNAANGGPCQKPGYFATDPQARQYFQRRLRYIAARWGYSPNLLAWEFWNEADLTQIMDKDMVTWVKEMTTTLRQYDPYRHLVSISYAGRNPPSVLNLPEIDILQVHMYSSQDSAVEFPRFYHDIAELVPDKPVLFGEYGYSSSGDNMKNDQEGIHLHNGLWAATFSGFASPTMYWWWDNFIEPLNLWGQYAVLYDFLQGEDMTAFAPSEVQLSSSEATTLALRASNRTLVWLKNNSYVVAASQSTLDQELQGISLTLTGLPDGSYHVRWYDPYKGEWPSEASAESKGGSLIVTVPDFSSDLAAKIEPLK
jgi:hypothetical protein